MKLAEPFTFTRRIALLLASCLLADPATVRSLGAWFSSFENGREGPAFAQAAAGKPAPAACNNSFSPTRERVGLKSSINARLFAQQAFAEPALHQETVLDPGREEKVAVAQREGQGVSPTAAPASAVPIALLLTTDAGFEVLTPPEIEVLAFYGRGWQKKEIAYKLPKRRITSDTVEVHLQNARVKIGIKRAKFHETSTWPIIWRLHHDDRLPPLPAERIEIRRRLDQAIQDFEAQLPSDLQELFQAMKEGFLTIAELAQNKRLKLDTAVNRITKLNKLLKEDPRFKNLRALAKDCDYALNCKMIAILAAHPLYAAPAEHPGTTTGKEALGIVAALAGSSALMNLIGQGLSSAGIHNSMGLGMGFPLSLSINLSVMLASMAAAWGLLPQLQPSWVGVQEALLNKFMKGHDDKAGGGQLPDPGREEQGSGNKSPAAARKSQENPSLDDVETPRIVSPDVLRSLEGIAFSPSGKYNVQAYKARVKVAVSALRAAGINPVTTHQVATPLGNHPYHLLGKSGWLEGLNVKRGSINREYDDVSQDEFLMAVQLIEATGQIPYWKSILGFLGVRVSKRIIKACRERLEEAYRTSRANPKPPMPVEEAAAHARRKIRSERKAA